ncbi:MAG: hypothetical protein K2X82_19370 [Gemmataceae bacterium]|nr:hypothetical protein [Gemmataceae bacterium]
MARTRSAFRKLAEVRVREAKALLDAKLWDGAYYLAGYAVECGLKACIAKLTRRFEFPDKKFAADCHTHKIDELVFHARLRPARDEEIRADPQFNRNWETARLWTETARYERRTEDQARALVEAVADDTHGVLRWLRQHW